MKTLKTMTNEELLKRYIDLQNLMHEETVPNLIKSISTKMKNTQIILMKRIAQSYGVDYLDKKVMSEFMNMIEKHKQGSRV